MLLFAALAAWSFRTTFKCFAVLTFTGFLTLATLLAFAILHLPASRN